MNFVNHSKLSGLHAPFSPSQPVWLRYSDEKAITVRQNKKAAELGTRLHAWAKETIDMGIKQPRSKKLLNIPTFQNHPAMKLLKKLGIRLIVPRIQQILSIII